MALQLADGYLSEETTAGDDELLCRAARQDVGGDLEVHFWRDVEQLDQILLDRMGQVLGLRDGREAYIPFNSSIGISNGKDKKHDPQLAENWQVLSPVRRHQFGTVDLNRRSPSAVSRWPP